MPVAPAPADADVISLLAADHPVKRTDMLLLKYRLKAGASGHLDIKVRIE